MTVAVRRAQVGAGALGAWLVTAGGATAGAVAVGAAASVFAGEFHGHCCEVVRNAVARQEIFESSIFLGD